MAAEGSMSAPPLKSHDSAVLDLAFALDCTGSMGSYIHHAQQNIRKIVEEIVCSEKCDVHMALVEYRDHPPQDTTFVTRVQDFTPSISTMKKTLDNCQAAGGGDTPEAVTAALHQALKLSWREEATKICVLISDAPPHGVNTPGDGFPNGCPDNLDPMEIVSEMAEKGITLYVVGCEPAINPYKNIFQAFAYNTGGQYVPLTNASLLSKVIIGGAQEEISLSNLMQQVQMDVEEEMQLAGGELDEDAASELIFEKLRKKGAKTRALKSDTGSLAPASAQAIEFSKMKNLSALRSKFKPESSSVRRRMAGPAPMRGGPAPMMGCPAPMMSCAPAVMCDSVAPPPPPGGYALDSAPSASEAARDYNVVEQSIDLHQAKRLVKKSMAKMKR